MTSRATNRRTVLFASAAALTAGCGSDDEGDGGTTTSAPATPSTPADTSAPAATETAGATPRGSASAAGPALAKTSDIPVGGGTVFADRKVVVTQPKAGSSRRSRRSAPIRAVW